MKTAFDEFIDVLNNKPWLATDFKHIKKLAHEFRRKDREERKAFLNFETDIERMLADAMSQKDPFESIDLYHDTCTDESKAFVVKLINIDDEKKSVHFRDLDFFQGLKRCINHIHHRDENGYSKWINKK